MNDKPVPVDSLSPLARLLVPRDTRYVSASEADLARRQAVDWAREMFDDKSARPWIGTALRPREAAYLARNGVTPDMLNLEYPTNPFGDTDPAWVAIRLGHLSVERFVGLLRATGELPDPEKGTATASSHT